MKTLPEKTVIYTELQAAFTHFNKALFDGKLADPVFTLQNNKKYQGYSSKDRYAHCKEAVTANELCMNPGYFAIQPISATMQTLVHEMAHLWQYQFGNPSRRAYHNSEWANKMESIGLMPFSTGLPGGKRTGERIIDYPIPGAAFEKACDALLTEEFRLSWVDRLIPHNPDPGFSPEATGLVLTEQTGTERKTTREKYSCPECKNNIWGKPGLTVFCGGTEAKNISHEPARMEAANE